LKLAAFLQLGRISNLPTVWSNVLVGVVLAGGRAWTVTTLLITLAVSLLYVGGMFLNDAFDVAIDARERPERPIPRGLVSANTVFAIGFGLLLAGIAATIFAVVTTLESGWRPILASVALSAAITYYDWNHKDNALSPFFMGLCRVLAYVTAGYAAASAPATLMFMAALVCLYYLIGLTYIAKQESLNQIGHLWPLIFLCAPIPYVFAQSGVEFTTRAGVAAILATWILYSLSFLMRRAKGDVPRAVVRLIAGISLMDAALLYLTGASGAATFAGLCFVATLALQNIVSGT
jgi:heme O synthase-like polyprenyltransferase